MKKDMPLEGLRWSRDSGSALYDTPQNGRSRTGWGGQQIGVMCSDGLRKVGLYEKYLLSKNLSSKVLYPTEELQVCVTKGICNSKNTKRFLPISDEENPVNCFSKVCDWFIHQGCDTIIAGCTDIRNVFYGEYAENVWYIDSLEVLANSILKASTADMPKF